MFGFDERLPSGSVQTEKGIIIDPMALRAVLAYDLPYGTVRPVHLRPRCSSSLRGGWRGDGDRQHGSRDQNNQAYSGFSYYRFHQVSPGRRPVLSPRLSRWMP